MQDLLSRVRPAAQVAVAQRNRPALLTCAVIVGYCLLAALAYWPIAPVDSHVIPGVAYADPVQAIWYLEWIPYALLHGHNLFFTNYIDYPSGVNLLTNAEAPALGLAASPVTLILGPVATYNLLLRLALASSATSMYFVLRTWTRSRLAAFAGGLLYGFGSYMADQGQWHLQLAFAPIPPLILWCLNELFFMQRQPPRRIGIWLGLLCAVQFLIHSEILTDCVLIGAIGALALAAMHRQDVWQRARRILTGLAWASACFVVICIYPLWFLIAGPRHINGPISPLWLVSQEHADLLGPIRRNIVVHLMAQNGSALMAHGTHMTFVDNTGYLGLPLAAVLALTAMVLRRKLIVRISALLAFSSYVLSLGPHLNVDGHNTGVPLPGLLLTHVPLLDDIIWNRWSLFMALFASIMLGVGIDRWLENGPRTPNAGTVRHRLAVPSLPINVTRLPKVVGPTVGCALVVVTVLPLLSPYPLAGARITWPSSLVGSLRQSVPAGGVVLALPYVTSATDAPMAWQALDHMQFRIVGGYATVPNPAGGGYFHVAPTRSLNLLNLAVQDAGTGALAASSASTLAVHACQGVPSVLRQFGIDSVVVWPSGNYQQLVTGFLRPALGLPSKRFGQALVWYDVQRLLRRRSHCGSEAHLSAMAARKGWLSFSPDCWVAPPSFGTTVKTTTVPGKGSAGEFTAMSNRPYYTFAEMLFPRPQNWSHKKYIRMAYKGTASGKIYQIYFELSPSQVAKYALIDKSNGWRTVLLPTTRRGVPASAWSHVIKVGMALGPKSASGTLALGCPAPS